MEIRFVHFADPGVNEANSAESPNKLLTFSCECAWCSPLKHKSAGKCTQKSNIAYKMRLWHRINYPNFLLAATILLVCAAEPNVSNRLNKYCGPRIYNNDTNIPCYLLAGAYEATPIVGTLRYQAVIVEIYNIPALPSLLYTGSDVNFTAGPPPTYQNYSGIPLSTLMDVTLTPPELPETVTFPLPYCTAAAIEVANGDTNLEYDALDPITGSVVHRTGVPAAHPTCYLGMSLYNYEPICSAKTSQEFDMNCNTDAQSFDECSNNPLLLAPALPEGFQTLNITAAGNVTANAAGDLLNIQALQTGLSQCSGWGTSRNRFNYGFPFPTTTNQGIPPSDLGSPITYAGTVTYLKDPSCTATAALAFRIDGVPSSDLLSPILIRSKADVPEAARIAYIPQIQCNTKVPRPLASPRRAATVTVAPYCRIAGVFSNDVPAPPSTAYYTSKSGGVVPPAGLNDGNIVYVVSASNLPDNSGTDPFLSPNYPTLSAWTKIRAVYPTNTNFSRDVVTVFPRNRFRVFFTLNQDFNVNKERALIYAQKFSPSAPLELVASEARVNNIPSCNCYLSQVNSTVLPDSRGLLPCRLQYDPILEIPVPYYSQPTLSFSGTRPACTAKLLNGFLNSSNGILESGLYTARGFASGATSYSWRFSAGTQSSVTIVSGQTSPDVQFRVFSSTQTQILELTVSAVGGLLTYNSTCSLQLRAFKGAPVVNVFPTFAQVGVGQGVVLNATLSTSPTGEPLTYTWYVIAPDPNAQVFTSTTGPIVTFLGTTISTYNLKLTVSNGRVSTDRQVTIIVSDVAPLPNTTTNIPSICQSYFNNNGTTNVTFPPFNATDPGFMPQPPQVPSIILPPNSASPGLTPQEIIDGEFDTASESFITIFKVFIIFAICLGGILIAVSIYWFVKRIIQVVKSRRAKQS